MIFEKRDKKPSARQKRARKLFIFPVDHDPGGKINVQVRTVLPFYKITENISRTDHKRFPSKGETYLTREEFIIAKRQIDPDFFRFVSGYDVIPVKAQVFKSFTA